MTALPQITIEVIDERSPYLPAVIALGDAHKKTLSFFPEGATRVFAAKVRSPVGGGAIAPLLRETGLERYPLIFAQGWKKKPGFWSQGIFF
ncbi:MAG: hypothetical protein AB4352_23930 [Hormoscilla sp.]